jgi:hypothetical protein
MEGIQARQARVVREHGEWLQEHDRAIAEIRELGRQTDQRIRDLATEHDRAMAEIRESGRQTDQRIRDLVSGMGEFIRRLNPPSQ